MTGEWEKVKMSYSIEHAGYFKSGPALLVAKKVKLNAAPVYRMVMLGFMVT